MCGRRLKVCTCGLHNKDDAVEMGEVREGGGSKVLPAQTVFHPLVGNQDKSNMVLHNQTLSALPYVRYLPRGCLVSRSHLSQTHEHRQMLEGRTVESDGCVT